MIDLLLIILLIIANGLFAMSEMAVVSARKIRLQQRANDGDKRAKSALKLAQNPGRFLSTVQVGITLVSILTGAVGGATLSDNLAVVLDDIPALAPYSGTLSFIIVVVGVTYLSLLVGELVPKQIALSNSERIAGLIAAPMTRLARLASPIVSLLNAS
ncbi:MAG: CNNM domain-containing protein, partial [Anaerolineae bacterium]|nr:CNNM domain-containing protein [Anaerolineae bacterium]